MQPNILFLFPDQHRPDYVGFDSSNPVRTPHIDALAARGIAFRNAICPSPLCSPCRACMATGRAYPAVGVHDNGQSVPDGEVLLYHRLQAAGYHTMGCGKFDLHKPRHDWGLDGRNHLEAFGLNDGMDSEGKLDGAWAAEEAPGGPFTHMLEERGLREIYVKDLLSRMGDGYLRNDPCPLPDEAYGDNWVGGIAEDLIRRAPRDRPWFLQANFPGPHDPWDITESMKELYAGVEFPEPIAAEQTDPGRLRLLNGVRQNYAAMVTNIDRWLGRLIEAVAARGELDNTLIVYASDHGEMLGDHDRFAKTVPYWQSAGVPLIMAGPGVAPRAFVDAPMALLDLSATFLDLAGAEVPGDWDSASLRPYLADPESAPPRKVVSSGLDKSSGDWRLTFDGRYKYVTGFEGAGELLWDVVADPSETENLLETRPREAAKILRILNTG